MSQKRFYGDPDSKIDPNATVTGRFHPLWPAHCHSPKEIDFDYQFSLDHTPHFLYVENRFQFHNSIPIEQQENSMSLTDLRHGQSATITAIPDEYLRVQLLRFGITCGSEIRCHCKLPLGPVVLKFGSQEIALGREIARMVSVEANR